MAENANAPATPPAAPPSPPPAAARPAARSAAAAAKPAAPATSEDKLKAERQAATEKKRAAAAAAVGTYHVEVGEFSADIEARDEAEAWAKFNDAHKTSYGPKYPGRKVEKIA